MPVTFVLPPRSVSCHRNDTHACGEGRVTVHADPPPEDLNVEALQKKWPGWKVWRATRSDTGLPGDYVATRLDPAAGPHLSDLPQRHPT